MSESNLIERKQLRSYQNIIVNKCKSHPFYGVFAEPGTGKTICLGTVIADLNLKTLIVSTPRIIDHVWRQELSAWEHTAHLSVGNLHCPPKKRARHLDNQVLLITFNLLDWFKSHGCHIDCIIIDESSCIKNPSSKRFKLLRELGTQVQRRYILSGTPRPNSALDLYGQLAFLTDMGKAPWDIPYSQFQLKYFITNDPMGWSWRPRAGVEALLTKIVARDAISIRTADCLDLPKITIQDLLVHLPDSVTTMYLDMESQLLLTLQDGVIDAVSSGVLVGKLRQITAGAIYDDTGQWHQLHDEKLMAVKELVDSISTPVMIVYQFRHDLERLQALFPQGEVMRDIDRWNNDEIPVMFLQPKSAGHGLNLQHGSCQHQIWLNLSYSSEEYQQTIARLHRSGQNKPIFVHRIIAQDTIDVTITDVLANKVGGQNALLEQLKIRRQTK